MNGRTGWHDEEMFFSRRPVRPRRPIHYRILKVPGSYFPELKRRDLNPTIYPRLVSRLRICLRCTSTYHHALKTWCLINLEEIFTLSPTRIVTEETPIFGDGFYQSLVSTHSSTHFIILSVSHNYER
jgi:hypothetical protein